MGKKISKKSSAENILTYLKILIYFSLSRKFIDRQILKLYMQHQINFTQNKSKYIYKSRNLKSSISI